MSVTTPRRPNATMNDLRLEDSAAHRWYRFVLSFPPHLVRDYAQRFDLDSSTLLLDPFCGTGTTVVEARKLAIPSRGIEPLPMARFAASTKADWTPHPGELLAHAESVATAAERQLASCGFTDTPTSEPPNMDRMLTLPPAAANLLPRNAISALPLHKTLTLLDALRR